MTMNMTEQEVTQVYEEAIKNACEKFYETFPEELQDSNIITKFVETLVFELDYSPQEIVEYTMKKELHTLLYNDHALRKMRKVWASLIKSNPVSQNKNSINFGIGDAAPETKKNQLNLQILSKFSRLQELVQKNLTNLEVDTNFPLVALKIYTSKAEEVKAFAEQMMEMMGVEEIFSTLPIHPEINFLANEDHLIVSVTAKKSLELTFMTFLIRSFLSKLPEHDVEIDLSFLLGTNFGDLINNHTDNTIRDVLNGIRINIEFRNNLKEFLEMASDYFFFKAQKMNESEAYDKRKSLTNSSILRGVAFGLGGAAINSNMKLNMGVNEVKLLENLGIINIFDKNGFLSKTPIGQAKMMMDSNEMVGPIMDLMNTMEGKGELYAITPIVGVHGEIDVSSFMDLAMHVINMFSE